MKKSVALGIDIGGTNTIYGFIGLNGSILFHEEIPTHGSMPILDLVGRINKKVDRFLIENSNYELKGIGIGAPNGNHYTGLIQSPPNLSWGNVDIVSIFNKHFGCEVILTNDANAAALGENRAAILKNHGLLTTGKSVDAAVWAFLSMDRCCQSQLMAENSGQVELIKDDVATLTKSQVGSEEAMWASTKVHFII